MAYGETFEGERISLDGESFVDCTFRDCTLVYEGGEIPPAIHDNRFRGCRWQFEGAAGRTVSFMAAMYGGLDGHGREVVERTFDRIRGEVGGDD